MNAVVQPGSDEPINTDPPKDRKFPCPGCGARIEFDPQSQGLKCPYCGYAEAIVASGEGVQERDWDAYWAGAGRHSKPLAGRSLEVQCQACAAVVLLEDKVVTDKCPYCNTHLENHPVEAQGMIAPEGIIPFKINKSEAGDAFRKWLGTLWFAPTPLKEFAARGQLNGVFLPYWTYDSMTHTDYQGQRGDNYQEVETYTDNETYTETVNGQVVTKTRPVTKTRTVTKIRWTWVSGHVRHFFDDVLVCASESLNPSLVGRLAPWDHSELVEFQPSYLSGFQTERYTVGLKPGFEIAKGIMDGKIRQLCCRDIGGDHQQLTSVKTRYSAITFKHLLQPVWVAPYRFKNKSYQVLINGQTGKVAGTRPWDGWKIVGFILMILAIIAAVVGLFFLFQFLANSTSSVVRPAPRQYARAAAAPAESGLVAARQRWGPSRPPRPAAMRPSTVPLAAHRPDVVTSPLRRPGPHGFREVRPCCSAAQSWAGCSV